MLCIGLMVWLIKLMFRGETPKEVEEHLKQMRNTPEWAKSHKELQKFRKNIYKRLSAKHFKIIK